MIYTRLNKAIENKKVSEICFEGKVYANPYYLLFDCSKCEIIRGCSKKMNLMRVLTKNILEWLEQNRVELNNIEVYADYDLFEQLGIPKKATYITRESNFLGNEIQE